MAKRRYVKRTAQVRYAVGYVRVSSEEQAEVERFSLPAQRRGIEDYCRSRGWELVRVYADEGHSAHTDDISARPDFARMLDDVTERRVECDVVVTHSLDRYARSLIVALTTLADLCARGVVYSSVTESDFDYSDPERRLHLQILAMFAEYFSEKLSQHIRKSKAERVATGRSNGLIPWGYMRAPEGSGERGVPIPHPETAPGVRLMFDLYASGRCSDRDVADVLNAAGYRMVSKFHPGPVPIYTSTVRAMLRSRFYLGEVARGGERGKEWLPGLHEAIVAEDVWERAQAARRERRRLSYQPRRHTVVHIAAGLVRCVHCRRPLVANVRHGRQPSRYRDTSRDRGVVCAATHRDIRMSAVDAALVDVVARLRLPEDWRRIALGAIVAAGSGEDVEERRAQLGRELERAQRHLLDGYVTEEQFLARRADIRSALAALPDGGGTPRVDLERAAALVERLQEVWAAADPAGRRDLAHDLFQVIWCDLSRGAVVAVELHPDLRPLRASLGDEDGPDDPDDPDGGGGGPDGGDRIAALASPGVPVAGPAWVMPRTQPKRILIRRPRMRVPVPASSPPRGTTGSLHGVLTVFGALSRWLRGSGMRGVRGRQVAQGRNHEARSLPRWRYGSTRGIEKQGKARSLWYARLTMDTRP